MTDKPTNFITRHVASLRELASSMREAPGLAEILGKSASIIEQLVDGMTKARVEHEREKTEMLGQLHSLSAQMQSKVVVLQNLMATMASQAQQTAPEDAT